MPPNGAGRFSKSLVVAHFTPSDLDATQWSCKYCNNKVIFAQRTSSLHRHLELAHPENNIIRDLKLQKRRLAWTIGRLIVMENLPLRLAKSRNLEHAFVSVAPTFKLPSYDSVVEATTLMAETTHNSVR